LASAMVEPLPQAEVVALVVARKIELFHSTR